MSRRGWVLFIAMGLIWGVPYMMIKVAVESLTPATLVLSRTLIAAAILVPLVAIRGEIRPVLFSWKPLLAFAVTEMALPWFLISSAEQRLSSSLTGLLIAAVPLVAALIGWFTGGERLGTRRIVGLLVGFAGVAALVGLDVGHSNAVAVVQMAVVAVCYAVGPFILARYLSHLPGTPVIAVALAMTAVLYVVPGFAQLPGAWPPARVIWSVIGLGVLCTTIAFLVFFALIEEVGPVRAPVITYVNPAVAIALGVLLLGEPFTVGIAVGFVLVLAGSVMATRRSPAVEGAAAPV